MSEGSRALGAARWLSLAAAPTFAAMALLTTVGGNVPPMLCSSGHASPLTGMGTMYVLMSAFHFAPWLKPVVRRTRAIKQISVD